MGYARAGSNPAGCELFIAANRDFSFDSEHNIFTSQITPGWPSG